MNKNPSNEVGSNRVSRGGGWVNSAPILYCASHYASLLSYRGSIGFRLLRTKRNSNEQKSK